MFFLRRFAFRHLTSVVVPSAFLLSGCEPTIRREIVGLVDYSASDTSALVSHARLVSDVILPSMGSLDALTLLPIDQGSVQQPTRLLQIDLSTMVFTRDSDGFAHAPEHEAARLHAYVDSMRRSASSIVRTGATGRSRFSQSTDLVGAIRNAAALRPAGAKPGRMTLIKSALTGDRVTATRLTLIVMSDMLQDDRGMNFERTPPRSVSEAAKLVQSLRARGEIPDLSGVDVIISGATGTSAAQVDCVRVFWVQFFTAAHARLVAYDYDASEQLESYLRSSIR